MFVLLDVGDASPLQVRFGLVEVQTLRPWWKFWG
jgi:hypothetical protein